MRKFKCKIRAVSLVVLAASAGVSSWAAPAAAFEIFGWKVFGTEEDTRPVSDPVSYSLTFSAGDDDLKGKLEEASALYQEQKQPVSGDLGLVIKARDDRERLLAALYDNARFGAVVTVKVDGTEIDQLPAVPVFSRDKPVPVTIEVAPGPVFTIGQVHFTGDAARLNPQDYGLKVGDQANSGLVITAAGKVVSDLEQEGRPLARLTERNLVADHEANTVDVTIGAESGPIAPLGAITVSGSKMVNPEFVAKWSRLNEGEPYSPEEVADAAERLRKLGVFSTVSVTKANALDANGQIPMAITLADGKQRYFGVGAQFSSIDGAGLLGYWGHRNLFGNAESLKISGSVSRLGQTFDYRHLDYAASILFSKPGAFGPISTFNAGITAAAINPDTYRAASLGIYANASFELTRKDTVTGGVDLTFNETEDFTGTEQYLTFSLPVSWARDASNDKLDPTTGYRLNLSAIPSYEINKANLFSTFEASVTGYTPLGSDDSFVLAGKLAAGTLIGVESITDIPATRRFYAGGGGSVRGYGFQEIAPRNANDDPLGGRSYLLGSVETRFKINETFGVVPFLDFGTVGLDSIPDFSDFRAGAGIGIRYATPFGPLRLDVAVPLNPYPEGSRFGIYAGIGQAF